VVQQQLLTLFQQTEVPLAVEPLQVVELIRVVVQGHPLVAAPLHVFYPIVEFFHELQ